MANGFNFNFDLKDNSKEVLQATDSGIQKALTAMGLLCESYAQMMCPVRTGRLKNSITYDVRESEKSVYIGTNVEYAAYVEYGTIHMAAQPYLKPAVQNHMAQYQSIAEKYLKDATVSSNFT